MTNGFIRHFMQLQNNNNNNKYIQRYSLKQIKASLKSTAINTLQLKIQLIQQSNAYFQILYLN